MNRNFNSNGLHPARADAGLEPARARAFVPLVDGHGHIESVTGEQSMQNGAEAESSSRTGKGGRPRKSYDSLVGTVHHFLVIDRILRRAQNEPYAATTCTRCRRPHRMPFARHPEWPHEELQVLAPGAVSHQRRGSGRPAP